MSQFILARNGASFAAPLESKGFHAVSGFLHVVTFHVHAACALGFSFGGARSLRGRIRRARSGEGLVRSARRREKGGRARQSGRKDEERAPREELRPARGRPRLPCAGLEERKHSVGLAQERGRRRTLFAAHAEVFDAETQRQPQDDARAQLRALQAQSPYRRTHCRRRRLRSAKPRNARAPRKGTRRRPPRRRGRDRNRIDIRQEHGTLPSDRRPHDALLRLHASCLLLQKGTRRLPRLLSPRRTFRHNRTRLLCRCDRARSVHAHFAFCLWKGRKRRRSRRHRGV